MLVEDTLVGGVLVDEVKPIALCHENKHTPEPPHKLEFPVGWRGLGGNDGPADIN